MMFSFILCVVSDAFADEDADLANKIAKMISLSSAYTGAEPTQEERESFLRECEEYENAYKNARENEQSLANRTLTARTIISQQNIDSGYNCRNWYWRYGIGTWIG